MLTVVTMKYAVFWVVSPCSLERARLSEEHVGYIFRVTGQAKQQADIGGKLESASIK
jgi:hypothetical protein